MTLTRVQWTLPVEKLMGISCSPKLFQSSRKKETIMAQEDNSAFFSLTATFKIPTRHATMKRQRQL